MWGFSRRGGTEIHRTAVMSVPSLLRLAIPAVTARAMRAVGLYDKAARLRSLGLDRGPKMSYRGPLCHRCNCNRKRQGGDRRLPTYAQHDTPLRSLAKMWTGDIYRGAGILCCLVSPRLGVISCFQIGCRRARSRWGRSQRYARTTSATTRQECGSSCGQK